MNTLEKKKLEETQIPTLLANDIMQRLTTIATEVLRHRMILDRAIEDIGVFRPALAKAYKQMLEGNNG